MSARNHSNTRFARQELKSMRTRSLLALLAGIIVLAAAASPARAQDEVAGVESTVYANIHAGPVGLPAHSDHLLGMAINEPLNAEMKFGYGGGGRAPRFSVRFRAPTLCEPIDDAIAAFSTFVEITFPPCSIL